MENPLGKRLRELPGPVLLTGHTGFKGTWMTFLLEYLKVPVVGYSLEPEKDSLFDRAKRTAAIPEVFADIRDFQALEKFIDFHKPSTIIHMAAQPLVLKSYETPRETFAINVMGTVNLLDIAFTKEYVKAVTIVTTDKVYKNDNSGKAFIESDPLEGKDPYSASKVGTEAVVAAWQQIAKVTGGPVVTSVRAGNVIGGGDFARDRLIPDLIRGLISGNVVEIRNPESIRPWQHVLDPLAGYLQCLESALIGEISNSFNFGPSGKMITVAEIISIARTMFPEIRISYLEHSTELEFESAILNLDSKNSTDNLNWKPFFNQKEAIISTLEWWQKYLMDNSSPSDSCLREIESFLEIKD